jgi:hypothetical protein
MQSLPRSHSSRRRAPSALGAILTGSIALAGPLGCADDSPEVGVDDAEIIGGFPANHARYDAVGAIGEPAFGGGWFPFCTASLITPTAVITAEHCVLGNMQGVHFLIGFDATSPKRAVPILGASAETSIFGGFVGLGSDVAIVHLAEPVTDITPVALGTLDDSMVGKRLIAMGYGYQNNSGRSGTRFMGSETYNGSDGNFLDYLYGSLEAFRPHYPNLADWVKEYWPTPEDLYAGTDLLDGYEAHFGGRRGDAQDCYGDSGGPIMKSVNGTFTTYGVVSGGIASKNMVCDAGGVFSTFGPATLTFIERELLCPLIPEAGKCEGDTVIRCATPDEGGYRPLATDCADLGLTCGYDEAGELGCVEESIPVELSCEGNCGGAAQDPVTGAFCFCDDLCTDFGDCCGDYAEVCEAEPAAPFAQSGAPARR